MLFEIEIEVVEVVVGGDEARVRLFEGQEIEAPRSHGEIGDRKRQV